MERNRTNARLGARGPLAQKIGRGRGREVVPDHGLAGTNRGDLMLTIGVALMLEDYFVRKIFVRGQNDPTGNRCLGLLHWQHMGSRCPFT